MNQSRVCPKCGEYQILVKNTINKDVNTNTFIEHFFNETLTRFLHLIDYFFTQFIGYMISSYHSNLKRYLLICVGCSIFIV